MMEALARVVPAPPDEVWRLWTTPAGLEAWFFPAYLHVRASVDLRAGGRWRLASEDQPFALEGEYLVVDAPRRLVMRTTLVTTVDLPPHARTEELVLAPAPEGTTLTLRIDAPDAATLRAAVGAWGIALARLDAAIRRNRSTSPSSPDRW